MKLFHFLILILFFNAASAQRIQILSSESKQPIGFATVLLLKNGKTVGGGYADEKGFYEIRQEQGTDSIKFTALGFQASSLNIKEVKGEIFMAPKAVMLDEVAINSKRKSKVKDLMIGTPLSGNIIYMGASVGFEIINRLHKVGNSRKNIVSFTFSSNIDCPKPFRAAFRIVFYEAKENGKPDSIISQQVSQVFFLSKGKQKNQKLDLSNLGLKISSESLYAGIEWLGFVNEQTGEFSDMEWKDSEFYAGIAFVTKKTEKPDLCIRSKFGNQNWTDLMDDQTRIFYKLDRDEYAEPAFQIELAD